MTRLNVLYRMLLLSVVFVSACKDLVGNPSLSAGETDPTTYNTADGVFLRAEGVRVLFRQALNRTVLASGLLTDELQWAVDPYDIDGNMQIDARELPDAPESDPSATYNLLQNLRVQAALAATALQTYAPDSGRATRGEMLAIEGYAHILLADLFCSGIPLSMPRTAADIDYRPGSSRDLVYARAIALFDSALVLAADSVPLMTLARVGRGRAWLGRGQFDSAAHAVAAVGDADAYRVRLVIGVGDLNGQVDPTDLQRYVVSDSEGRNGLAYRSSHDPRTQVTAASFSYPLFGRNHGADITTYYPVKYTQAARDSVTFTVADAVEARLITAEAALHAGDVGTWRATLNALRTTGRQTRVTYFCIADLKNEDGTCTFDPPDSSRVDTIQAAGIGGVDGLVPLVDPGTPTARVDTMFAERAAWLFLTAHRQGDLRRLIRSVAQGGYGRRQSDVYPSGGTAGGIARGSAVTFAIPSTENLNPYFQGCLNRDP